MYFQSEIGAAWFKDSFDIKDKTKLKCEVFLFIFQDVEIMRSARIHIYILWFD